MKNFLKACFNAFVLMTTLGSTCLSLNTNEFEELQGKNPYDVLCIPLDSSKEKIESAYKTLSLLVDPTKASLSEEDRKNQIANLFFKKEDWGSLSPTEKSLGEKFLAASFCTTPTAVKQAQDSLNKRENAYKNYLLDKKKSAENALSPSEKAYCKYMYQRQQFEDTISPALKTLFKGHIKEIYQHSPKFKKDKGTSSDSEEHLVESHSNEVLARYKASNAYKQRDKSIPEDCFVADKELEYFKAYYALYHFEKVERKFKEGGKEIKEYEAISSQQRDKNNIKELIDNDALRTKNRLYAAAGIPACAALYYFLSNYLETTKETRLLNVEKRIKRLHNTAANALDQKTKLIFRHQLKKELEEIHSSMNDRKILAGLILSVISFYIGKKYL